MGLLSDIHDILTPEGDLIYDEGWVSVGDDKIDDVLNSLRAQLGFLYQTMRHDQKQCAFEMFGIDEGYFEEQTKPQDEYWKELGGIYDG